MDLAAAMHRLRVAQQVTARAHSPPGDQVLPDTPNKKGRDRPRPASAI